MSMELVRRETANNPDESGKKICKPGYMEGKVNKFSV